VNSALRKMLSDTSLLVRLCLNST